MPALNWSSLAEVYVPDIQVVPVDSSVKRRLVYSIVLHREAHVYDLDVVDMEYLLFASFRLVGLLETEDS